MFFAWYGCFHYGRTNKMDDLGLVLGNLHIGRVQFWGTQGPRLYILVQLVSMGRSIHGNTNKKKLKKWPLNPYYMRWWSLASEDLQETITPKYRGVLPINCPVNQFCEYPLAVLCLTAKRRGGQKPSWCTLWNTWTATRTRSIRNLQLTRTLFLNTC